jgi:predicted ferric reductase
MTVWETVTWDVARAGGLTAYVLLTAAVIVGLALSLKYQSPRWPRLINSEWHNYLTLLSTIFLGVHVLAVTVDPYTHFGLSEILVPLASHYRPFWMALGIVGLYLGIAIGISTWMRPLIGYQVWRRLHVLTLVVYALATVHGIFTGTDTLTWWGWGLYICSIVPVAILTAIRLLGPEEPARQPKAVASPVARR